VYRYVYAIVMVCSILRKRERLSVHIIQLERARGTYKSELLFEVKRRHVETVQLCRAVELVRASETSPHHSALLLDCSKKTGSS
jgi:hypothetical protein